ncbi:MAG: PQQ-binding-like beta-propeller repeat protein, partial [Phycisphaerae bacterium]
VDPKLPAAFGKAWRARYGQYIVEERLKLPVKIEKARLAGLTEGILLTAPVTPAALHTALVKHYPDPFGSRKFSPVAEYQYFQVLAAVNPALEPDGFHQTGERRAPKQGKGLHATVPLGDEENRVYRYTLDANTPILLPPATWVKARVSDVPIPAAEPSADGPATRVYCIRLKGALRGGVPLKIFLSRRGKMFTSAWGFTPTVSNRLHRVAMVPQDGNDVQFTLAAPTPEGVDALVLRLSLEGSGDLLGGTWGGTRGEDDDKEEIEGVLTGVKLSEAMPATDEVKGRWDWFLGPRDTAVSGEPAKLVRNLDHAKLVWGSDERIPVGRGPDTRGKVRPITHEVLSGGWASPVVDEGRVFLSYYVPSGKHYAWGAEKAFADEPDNAWMYRLNLIEADDVIHCFDARTGRTLWKRRYPGSGLSWSGFNKSGPEMTPAVADGRVYAVGTLGTVFCVDAETGRTLWINDIGRRARLLAHQRMALIARGAHFGSRSDFSTRVVPAGEVVAVCDHVRTKGGDEHYRYELQNGLIGFDRKTGAVRWHLPQVGSSASRWVHKGKDYLLASGLDKVRCIDPDTGKVLWTIDGDTGLLPLPTTEEAMLCYSPKSDGGKVTCWDISPAGAKKRWTSRHAGRQSTPMAILDGHAYVQIDSQRDTVCLSMTDGSETGRVNVGSGNGSAVLAGGRMLITPDQSHSKPIVHWIHTDPGGFRLLDTWQVPISGSYTTPLQMPIVDGRLFVRFRDRLMCYDLRAASAVTDRPHAPKDVSVGPVAPPQPKKSPTGKPKDAAPDKPRLPDGPILPDGPDLDPLQL